jgi:mannosylglycoprotein endo-beta-mannosidase
MIWKTFVLSAAILLTHTITLAQREYELNSGWVCRKASDVASAPAELSLPGRSLDGWMPAVVPGTVLTTMLQAHLIEDPFFGMNNKHIPDIYTAGRDYYTYWFVRDFTEKAGGGIKAGSAGAGGSARVWLQFRGVNYGYDVYLNGHRLADSTHYGMFLRANYDITPWLAPDGHNRLAVIVYPPDPPGNPNGGQGGDGAIARNVAHQYVAGWDWIQPIRDRNTGIWDKVLIRETGAVKVGNPHIVTLVPGRRQVEGPQSPALIKVTAELTNSGDASVSGEIFYQLEGHRVSSRVSLPPHATREVALPGYWLAHPRLWWPNGYGPQALYHISLRFAEGGNISDEEQVTFGVREIQATWNAHTQSRQIAVNGQRIFIKGGNWIVSDAMLRLSSARYDAEIRFHRDMRLNLIRVWGGALTERPEFYAACDRYGLLVMQDFWNSGDCNGRWPDPKKLDNQETRRKYPDDHGLFLASAADQIKMIRNHPSLAFWCGGNEITPPPDILQPLRDSLIPQLDGTRWFADYSNTDSMSHNTLGGNGDGPYGIQPLETFWEKRTFPFNSEVGSVGVGDYASLERFMPDSNRLLAPGKALDSVWAYHKYIGYDHFPDAYGAPADAADFTRKAQLINYDQYRGLAEGFSAHLWDWYTGVIIWKTQNPWTALRGQMYDYYLDPNACLYGLRQGGEMLHAAYNPIAGNLVLINNTFLARSRLRLSVTAFDMKGRPTLLLKKWADVAADSTRTLTDVLLQPRIDSLRATRGLFLQVQLLSEQGAPLGDNLYWLPDSKGHYSGLQRLAPAHVQVLVKSITPGKADVTLTDPAGQPPAFFSRLSVIDERSRRRILPAFYSDNYFSLMPGQTRTIRVEWPSGHTQWTGLCLEGWNVPVRYLTIR